MESFELESHELDLYSIDENSDDFVKATYNLSQTIKRNH